MRLTGVNVLEAGKALALQWDGGAKARFHAFWLRDNGLDDATRSPANGQRLITLLDIPAETAIAEAAVDAAGDLDVTLAPEMKRLHFTANWLDAHAYDRAARPAVAWTRPEIETWDRALQDRYTVAAWPDITGSRKSLGRWLAGVRRHGLAVLTGLPREPGALVAVAETFGYVRETNYGRWFEVRSEVNPSNLADTNLGLQAHTDNPYRDPVPTLQLLACLENTVEGGHSLVVDGFGIAQRLREEDPHGFELLSRHCARFEYAGSKGVRLSARRPVIELAPDGEVVAVRFNNRSAAPLVDVPFEHMEAYYRGLRRFAELVEDPAMAVSFKLKPGELFIVDNTRVLHARTAFSGTGTRWLQGCYADKDGLLSTLAAIEEETRLGAVA